MKTKTKTKTKTNKTRKQWIPIKGTLTLKHYTNSKKNRFCYNRNKNTVFNSPVDAHLHIRPFFGEAIPFEKLIKILQKSGVLFVEGYGIGQILTKNKDKCIYYKDCPETLLQPSLQNDILNAESLLNNDTPKIVVNLSMTFPDLTKPDEILSGMKYLNNHYPNMFHWMGEVNLVKHTIIQNGHRPATIENINNWAPFMRELRRQNMPLALHSDIGTNSEPLKYLHLIKKVMQKYPNNKIIWLHLGVSIEQSELDPTTHINILESFLKKYKNLYFDISWRILYDQIFCFPDKKKLYIDLFNKWPTRFLPGTDFVSKVTETESNYKNELRDTSFIFNDLNDTAFRCIGLGQNYFNLSPHLYSKYKAPQICNTMK